MVQLFTTDTRFGQKPPSRPRTSARSLAELLQERHRQAAASAVVEAAPAPAPEAPAPAPEPRFTAAEWAAEWDAKVQAQVQAARNEALAEARQERDEAVKRALEATAAALAEAATARTRADHDDMDRVARLVAALTRHVVPQAAAQLPLDDLSDALVNLCAKLQPQAAVTIHVHPSLAAAIDAALTGATPPEAKLHVEGDGNLALGDAVVRWPSGQAERHLDRIVEEALALCWSWLGRHPTPPAAANTPASETGAFERTEP